VDLCKKLFERTKKMSGQLIDSGMVGVKKGGQNEHVKGDAG
jgi:hypothetical protein